MMFFSLNNNAQEDEPDLDMWLNFDAKMDDKNLVADRVGNVNNGCK